MEQQLDEQHHLAAWWFSILSSLCITNSPTYTWHWKPRLLTVSYSTIMTNSPFLTQTSTHCHSWLIVWIFFIFLLDLRILLTNALLLPSIPNNSSHFYINQSTTLFSTDDCSVRSSSSTNFVWSKCPGLPLMIADSPRRTKIGYGGFPHSSQEWGGQRNCISKILPLVH